MRTPDDPLTIIRRKMDGLEEQLKTSMLLRQREFRDSKLDKKIEEDRGLYELNLENLRKLKAYDDLRQRTEWYKRYLNVSDPL